MHTAGTSSRAVLGSEMCNFYFGLLYACVKIQDSITLVEEGKRGEQILVSVTSRRSIVFEDGNKFAMNIGQRAKYTHVINYKSHLSFYLEI